jgi:hypothetical protein
LKYAIISFDAVLYISTFRAYQLEYKIKYHKSLQQKSRATSDFPNIVIYTESFAEHLAIAYYNEGNYLKASEYFLA